MSRPSPEVIAIVDAAVARLDATFVEDPDGRQTTSSYAAIATAWERFKFLIDTLDVAVAHPFAPGAPLVLHTAELLVTADVHELAFWLTHVGEALQEFGPG
jgi:hypothetical protein